MLNIYRITGYLCDSEICAFWPKKAVCEFYLRVALHGVWLFYHRYKLSLRDFQFYPHNRINVMFT